MHQVHLPSPPIRSIDEQLPAQPINDVEAGMFVSFHLNAVAGNHYNGCLGRPTPKYNLKVPQTFPQLLTSRVYIPGSSNRSPIETS